jgi:hypothetical protein
MKATEIIIETVKKAFFLSENSLLNFKKTIIPKIPI